MKHPGKETKRYTIISATFSSMANDRNGGTFSFEYRPWEIFWKLLTIYTGGEPAAQAFTAEELEKEALAKKIILDNLNARLPMGELTNSVFYGCINYTGMPMRNKAEIIKRTEYKDQVVLLVLNLYHFFNLTEKFRSPQASAQGKTSARTSS